MKFNDTVDLTLSLNKLFNNMNFKFGWCKLKDASLNENMSVYSTNIAIFNNKALHIVFLNESKVKVEDYDYTLAKIYIVDPKTGTEEFVKEISLITLGNTLAIIAEYVQANSMQVNLPNNITDDYVNSLSITLGHKLSLFNVGDNKVTYMCESGDIALTITSTNPDLKLENGYKYKIDIEVKSALLYTNTVHVDQTNKIYEIVNFLKDNYVNRINRELKRYKLAVYELETKSALANITSDVYPWNGIFGNDLIEIDSINDVKKCIVVCNPNMEENSTYFLADYAKFTDNTALKWIIKNDNTLEDKFFIKVYRDKSKYWIS